MMGRRKSEQGQLFYAFDLEAVVPDDHQVRRIAAVLDLSWVRTEFAPHYSHTGRPSIDPELMIQVLILGYVFAIRSERSLCREVQLNLAYRWFCDLGSHIISERPACTRARNERFRDHDVFRGVFERVVAVCIKADLGLTCKFNKILLFSIGRDKILGFLKPRRRARCLTGAKTFLESLCIRRALARSLVGIRLEPSRPTRAYSALMFAPRLS